MGYKNFLYGGGVMPYVECMDEKIIHTFCLTPHGRMIL